MMKTTEQILQAVKAGEIESEAIDGRDFSRLADFFPVSDYETFGFKLKDGAEVPDPIPLTQEVVLKQLAEDLDFGFEKALNKRGLSAPSMYAVVKMWMWVLDDPLQTFEEYAQYGLPFFKAVALKYGLPNPIGEDNGNEHKYSMYGGDN